MGKEIQKQPQPQQQQPTTGTLLNSSLFSILTIVTFFLIRQVIIRMRNLKSFADFLSPKLVLIVVLNNSDMPLVLNSSIVSSKQLGYAFVAFKTKEDTQKAIEELKNDKEFKDGLNPGCNRGFARQKMSNASFKLEEPVQLFKLL